MNECVYHWMEISGEELWSRELEAGVTTVYPASEQKSGYACMHIHRHTLKSHSRVPTILN